MKKTKIVASISDRRCDQDFIRKLFFAGMNVVRMNTCLLYTSDGFASHYATIFTDRVAFYGWSCTQNHNLFLSFYVIINVIYSLDDKDVYKRQVQFRLGWQAADCRGRGVAQSQGGFRAVEELSLIHI